MKTITLLLVATLACLVYASPVLAEGQSPADSLRLWAGAFEDGELDKIMAFYKVETEPTVILSSGETKQGVAEIRKMFEKSFAAVEFKTVSLSELRVETKGTMAWAVCRYTAKTEFKEDASQWIVDIRTSFVLRKSKGTWLIELEHSSPMKGTPRLRRVAGT